MQPWQRKRPTLCLAKSTQTHPKKIPKCNTRSLSSPWKPTPTSTPATHPLAPATSTVRTWPRTTPVSHLLFIPQFSSSFLISVSQNLHRTTETNRKKKRKEIEDEEKMRKACWFNDGVLFSLFPPPSSISFLPV
eukprot:TRINITY_DN2250_c0_g1_i4.p1 TRINITY_DN2250_c0_g1~~TRINITY_DN2250_c0_g1_i4.p1  ORF type:complete len:134 (+),score=15.71 TRINITY_DN2250_c0_g1_i4:803-1204(+)